MDDDDLPRADSGEPMVGRSPQRSAAPGALEAIAPPYSSPCSSPCGPCGARRARAVVQGIVWLLVAWMICHTWFLQGVFVPLGIPSGSMAEKWLGPHCQLVCAVCGQTFLCDAEVAPGRWRECPHCGDVAENRSPGEVLRGDRVWLVLSAYTWRAPRRWEVVAFREPDRASRLTVKRVAGMPGEAIEIRGGDVYADGEIRRKSLDEQEKMAVLVHDAAVKTMKNQSAEPRWRPEGKNSAWREAPGGYVLEHSAIPSFHHSIVPSPGSLANSAEPSPPAPLSAGDGSEHTDWLVYHHRRRAGKSWVDGPVTDELSYNQWRTRREDEVHTVGDLLLRFHAARIHGDGRLVIRAAGGKNRLEAWIRPKTGACEFRFNGQTVRRGKATIRTPIEGMEVTFSTVDRQLILALDGRPAVGRLLLPAGCSWEASPRPLAIGSAGLGLKLSEVRVYRDVYYVRPTGVLARWGFDRPARLASDEYFVLGDNSPISEDSRSWPASPGVPRRLIVGKPIRVPAYGPN